MNAQTGVQTTYKRKTTIQLSSNKQKSNLKLAVQTSKLTPLIDGPEIFDQMGDMLERAKKYIYITAWSMRMKTPVKRKKLGDWLIEKAKQGVKVKILWCDLDKKMSPFNERKAINILLKRDKTNNIKVVLSELKELGTTFANQIQTIHGGTIGSHHQKTVVVDGLYAICNGADITTGAINKTYWHDAAVYIQGKGVKGIEENFVKRWNNEAPKDGVSEQITLNPKAKASSICETILTIPSWWWKNYDIKNKYEELIKSAKKSIYIENQYLRHPDMGGYLADAAKKGIDIYILVPKFPEEIEPGKKNMKIEAKIMHYSQFKVLKAIATGNDNWLDNPVDMIKKERKKKTKHLKNVKIMSTSIKAKPYCHSKLMIVDEKISIVGSANLNRRSLDAVVDSECNVVIEDTNFALQLRKKLEISKGRYTVINHDIDGDEKITQFDKFNFGERDYQAQKLSKNILAKTIMGVMLTEKDPDKLRELYTNKFDFLL